MKLPRSGRVPVIEDAFELNLPKLMRTAKATGVSRLVLDDGDVRTVVVVTQTRLAVLLGGRTWLVDVVPVQCLNDRVRPLMACPRAHEGNFQSLYWSGGELACRHCLGLRYRSTLASCSSFRARLARQKLLVKLGGVAGDAIPARQRYKWRRRHRRLVARLASLTSVHYAAIRAWLKVKADVDSA